MKKSDFYYDLPEELIAQHPAEPRDSARLLVYHKDSGKIEDKHFYNIIDYLKPGDVLVVNDTKVIPARIYGNRDATGGKVEFLLHKRIDLTDWEVLAKPARKALPGNIIRFSDKLYAEVLSCGEDGIRQVRFHFDGVFEDILREIGEMPLPHYIHEKLEDDEQYQTVYAREAGSSAAPTAGLHFTEELLEKIKAKGVEIVKVLLHVGLGTFRPVKTDEITDHKMHSEYYCVTKQAADAVNKAKSEGRRIIAVGTTSVRVLESATFDGKLQEKSGFTQIFIYPPYQYKMVDALITNFHLPESTLVMLVSAFIGRENTLDMYKYAVEKKYRFFSFGDACFLV
ncbi:MAG: tRNA preQ1(34) S-adenosylmethionine ribosyltransferase-isomerase QueA [Firmicutes bacterium]|nr:tRNA preQ1(34) S-adenosylmethionine ribosyltransferase-isomerase QueA [Bacillota bacterium]MDY5531459.1 tRNA preQ1(34) S-adenosylmethionine ribosyltransferase-isomerase QueA [Pumilibacteraceae bacterium]